MPEPATLNKHSRNMKLNQVTSIAPPHKSIPPANAARDAQSAGFGVLMIPANIPLIPVIFPQRRNLETATAPMARPPLTALIGVKKGEMLLPTPLFSCIRLLCRNVKMYECTSSLKNGKNVLKVQHLISAVTRQWQTLRDSLYKTIYRGQKPSRL